MSKEAAEVGSNPSLKKRVRKKTAKALQMMQEPKKKMKEIWCTVELERTNGDKTEYIVSSNVLETEMGSPVTMEDLHLEKNVIWVSKGSPYEVTILELHNTKPSQAPCKRKQKEVTIQFSSDSECDVDSAADDQTNLPPAKQQKRLKDCIADDKQTKAVTTKRDHHDVGSCTFNDSSTSVADIVAMNIEVNDFDQYDDDEELGVARRTPTGTSTRLSKDDEEPSVAICRTPTMITKKPALNKSNHGGKQKFPVPFQTTPVNNTDRRAVSRAGGSQRQYDLKEQLCRIEAKLDKLCKFLEISSAKPTNTSKHEEEVDEKFTTETGIDLLALRPVDPAKYALQLLDILFTEQELACSCYMPSHRTKKPALDSIKVALLEETLKRKFGTKVFQEKVQLIRRKCMQKCIDKSRNTGITKKEDSG